MSGLRKIKSVSQKQLSSAYHNTQELLEQDQVVASSTASQPSRPSYPLPTPPEAEPGRSMEFDPSRNFDYSLAPEHDAPEEEERQATMDVCECAAGNEPNCKRCKRPSLVNMIEEPSFNGKTGSTASISLLDRPITTAVSPLKEPNSQLTQGPDTLRIQFAQIGPHTPGSSPSVPSPSSPAFAEDPYIRHGHERPRDSCVSSEGSVSPHTTWNKPGRFKEILRSSHSFGAALDEYLSKKRQTTPRQAATASQSTLQSADGKVYYESPPVILNLPANGGRLTAPQPERVLVTKQSADLKHVDSTGQTRTHESVPGSPSDASRSPSPRWLAKRFAMPRKASWSKLLQQPIQLKSVKSMPSSLFRKRKDPLQVTGFSQTPYRQRYSDALMVERNHIKALLRDPDIMDIDDDHDGDSLTPFELDIPDHLPSSPLCPLSPKHSNGQKSICPLHRRRKSSPPKRRISPKEMKGPGIVYDSSRSSEKSYTITWAVRDGVHVGR